jgi:NADPH:quinone reductase
MKAWLMDDFTGIDQLRLADAPESLPDPGQAVLDVKYAALNPADRYLAERQYPAKPKLPHILGRDGIGTVVAVGQGVHDLRIGEKRLVLRGDTGINRPGTFAQRVTLPAADLVELPTGWTEEQAAAGTLVYLTAYQALTMWGPLPSSAVVLVTGASGGVGVASVQLARALGYTVIGLSRSPEKSRRVRELGAHEMFDPQDPHWRKELKQKLNPRRVDLAIDNVGGKFFSDLIESLGELGKVSIVGRLAGPVPEFNTAALIFRRIRIGGVTVGAYTNPEARAAWQQVVGLLARTGSKPLIDQVFPFDQLPKAFARLAEGPMGKVLLRVNAS